MFLGGQLGIPLYLMDSEYSHWFLVILTLFLAILICLFVMYPTPPAPPAPPPPPAPPAPPAPVSYTHLRAHETRRHL
eukprot:6440943-Prorocentrum_lima.AAC.1